MSASPLYFSIDRFEESPAGRIAVLVGDDGGQRDVPASRLPHDAAEGMCVVARSNGTYAADEAETARRRARIRAKMNALFVD